MTAPIRYEFWSCDENSLCTDHHYFVYILLCLLRLNNINFHQFLSFIIYIDLNHYYYYYWTSESLLNLWECTQGSDITNKWVVHFVIVWPHLENKLNCFCSFRLFVQKSNVVIGKIVVKECNHLLVLWIR